MPPMSVHFSLGVLAATFGARRMTRADDRGPVALGLVAGSVMGDGDLIVGSLSALVAGEGAAKFIHRSLTHSFVVMAVFAIVGYALLKRNRRGGVGLLAGALSVCVFHIVPDTFYLVGVKFLSPITFHEFFLGPFSRDRFSDTQMNVITGLDFLSEAFTWMLTWWLAREYATESRFTRMLPWFALANVLLYSGMTFAIADRLPYECHADTAVGCGSFNNFLWWAYLPGVLNILLTAILVPILARDTWMALGEGPPPRWVQVGATRGVEGRRAGGGRD